MQDYELMWASGLFEGEGCFTISGTQARCKLNSTDEDVVRRFHAAVSVGHVRVDDAQIPRGHKRQWEWYTGKQADVLHVINLLYANLGSRRRARADELRSHINSRPGAQTNGGR